MSGPAFPKRGPLDGRTTDLLDLIANDPRHDDDRERFLAACRAAANPAGIVSLNDVRARLSNAHGLTIDPRRYSSLWRWACTAGHLRRLDVVERNAATRGGNRGKLQALYALATPAPSESA